MQIVNDLCLTFEHVASPPTTGIWPGLRCPSAIDGASCTRRIAWSDAQPGLAARLGTANGASYLPSAPSRYKLPRMTAKTPQKSPAGLRGRGFVRGARPALVYQNL